MRGTESLDGVQSLPWSEDGSHQLLAHVHRGLHGIYIRDESEPHWITQELPYFTIHYMWDHRSVYIEGGSSASSGVLLLGALTEHFDGLILRPIFWIPRAKISICSCSSSGESASSNTSSA